MSIIIHIGYPKTATTWLQKVFFPKVCNAVYIPRYLTFSKIVNNNSLKFNPIEVREFFMNFHKKEHLILSLEGLIGTTHNFGLNGYLTIEHANRLHSIFPEAVIIIFIRRQQDIISSNYVQYVKGGGTWGINKYLVHKRFPEINGMTLFSFTHFEYDYVIDYYVRLFGLNQVKIFLFESFQENVKKFIENFSKQLNLKVNMNNFKYQKVNIGYRTGILRMARVANHFTENKMLNKKFFIHIPYLFFLSKKIFRFLNRYRLFGTFPSARKILGVNYFKIVNYYKKTNNRLLTKYSIKELKKYNYPL